MLKKKLTKVQSGVCGTIHEGCVSIKSTSHTACGKLGKTKCDYARLLGEWPNDDRAARALKKGELASLCI